MNLSVPGWVWFHISIAGVGETTSHRTIYVARYISCAAWVKHTSLPGSLFIFRVGVDKIAPELLGNKSPF